MDHHFRYDPCTIGWLSRMLIRAIAVPSWKEASKKAKSISIGFSIFPNPQDPLLSITCAL